MIQANELRIGNKVSIAYQDKYPSISQILGTSVVLDMEGCNFDGLEYEVINDDLFPVELTPEILEKCGINKNSTGMYELIHKVGKRVNFRWVTGKFFTGEKLDTPFVRLDGYCDIYFLHQLQNLYFALTGEELNYTPCPPAKSQ